MARPTKSKVKTRKMIEELAEKAANEAIEEMELDSIDENEDDDNDRPDLRDLIAANRSMEEENSEQIMGKDVFRDAWRKAQLKNDVPTYYIYKNGTWIANKPYPYSWEKLQKEYGEGHYKIVAKSSLTGQNILIQAQLVGNPHAEETKESESVIEPSSHQPDPLAFLTAMSQVQERAEAKASQIASQQTSMITGMMQAIMQTQSQSNQQFQMMLMEMQKQNQAMAAENTKILLTLMTQKPQTSGNEQNLKMVDVIKLLQEERKNAKEEAKTVYELVDKKAEALAEIKAEAMAGGTGEEESLGKTLAKGFVPVLTQILAQGQAASQSAPMPQARVAPFNSTPVLQNIQPTANLPKIASSSISKAKVEPKPSVSVQQSAKPMTDVFNKQVEIINAVGVDIVEALMDRKHPKEVTPLILNKLEKTGTSRQTVLTLFKAEDFIAHARRLNIPAEADQWFREFYREIQLNAAFGSSNVIKPEEKKEVSSEQVKTVGSNRPIEPRQNSPSL